MCDAFLYILAFLSFSSIICVVSGLLKALYQLYFFIIFLRYCVVFPMYVFFLPPVYVYTCVCFQLLIFSLISICRHDTLPWFILFDFFLSAYLTPVSTDLVVLSGVWIRLSSPYFLICPAVLMSFLS